MDIRIGVDQGSRLAAELDYGIALALDARTELVLDSQIEVALHAQTEAVLLVPNFQTLLALDLRTAVAPCSFGAPAKHCADLLKGGTPLQIHSLGSSHCRPVDEPSRRAQAQESALALLEH